MTINIELFKAILAMDSYNRGYDEGIKLTGTQIGDATIGIDSSKLGFTTDIFGNPVRKDQHEGFYSISYKLSSGETIISYRGTDKNLVWPWSTVGSDLVNGYFTGGGYPMEPQAYLALQFYKAVASSLGVAPKAANISLTGHSLGGALAGFIGSLYGKNGTLFDNMAFESAASTAHDISSNPTFYATDPRTGVINSLKLSQADTIKNDIYGTNAVWATSRTGLNTVYLNGEFLSANRILQSTPQVGYDLGNNVNLPLLDAFKLHSMATLVIRMFANGLTGQDWRDSAQYFMPAFYSNTLAQKAGANSITGAMKDVGDYAGILRTALAYSAIDEGTRVFGDTGIRSLFNDANELGKVLGFVDASSVLKDNSAAISNIFTQFAGQMAMAANDNAEIEFSQKAA